MSRAASAGRRVRSVQPAVPRQWRAWLGAYRWRCRSTGLSGAGVYRLSAPGRPTLFVKVEPASQFSEVEAEAARLRWLEAHAIACPAVRATLSAGGRNWLVTSALPGRDLAQRRRADAARVVGLVAAALRDLHARPIADCPFEEGLAPRIALAHARIAAGDIEPDEFADEGGAEAALAALTAGAPAKEERVLTHGDACLPNFLAAGWQFTGFVDCGRFGIADRYRDLALACDSIAENLGETWVGPFLALYGIDEPDQTRLAFYQRFDAFF